MMRTIRLVVMGAAFAGAPVLAGQATFTLLTTEDAADVTVDEFDRTLVLTLGAGGVFVYENGGYNFVGSGDAWSLSADGNWIAGSIDGPKGPREAARGAATGGWLPVGGVDQCDSLSSGYGISGDGSTMVGLAWVGCSAQAFVWTETSGLQTLENLANGNNRATVVDAAGEVIAGFAQGNFNRTPAVWLASTGAAHPDYPFDPDVIGEIGAVNSDGSIVAGQYFDDTVEGFYSLPYYWAESEGIVILPPVEGYNGGFILGVSDDGRTMVGFSGTLMTGRVPSIWRPEWGNVALGPKLEELGADVPDNYVIQVARGISADGQTIAGWGIQAPTTPQEFPVNRAFFATLPPAIIPACTSDLNADASVGFGDLTELLDAWGPCLGCAADLDGSDQVGFADLMIMLSAWGPCP